MARADKGHVEARRPRRGRRVVVMLVIVVAAAWLLAGNGGGTFGQPVGAVAAPAPEWVPVDVTARLEGPVADDVGVRVASHHAREGRLGDDVMLWAQLVVTNGGDQPFSLPSTAWPRSDGVGGTWTSSDDGVVSAQPTAPGGWMVVAASDPSLRPHEIEAGTVSPGVPAVLEMAVVVLDLPSEARTHDVRLPFGDGDLVVTVDSGPAAEPPPWRRPVEPAQLAGTAVPVPEEGQAEAVFVGDGHPLWVSHTAEHGVVVVDARSPFSTGGPTTLVGWCATSQVFEVVEHGEQYAPHGERLAGPAEFGLTTYEARREGGALVLTGGYGVSARDAHQVQRSEEGDFAFWGNDGWGGGGGCGPTSPTEEDTLARVEIDDDVVPTVPLSLLKTARRSSLVEGRLLLEGDTGWLCESGGSGGWTCTGDRAPVSLPSPREPWVADPVSMPRAHAGPFVVGAMTDGTITALWQPNWSDTEYRPDAGWSTAARFRSVETDSAAVDDCDRWLPGCVALVHYTELRLLAADGWVEPHAWDGSLPEEWWLLQPAPLVVGQAVAGLTDLAALPDDLAQDELVIVREPFGPGGASVERLGDPGS